MTTEIPAKDWKQFCEALSSQHGELMDIRMQSDGDLQLVAQDVPLRAVLFDETSDACNKTIVVEFGLPDERPVQHRIIEPIRLVLRGESGGNRYHLLEMPAESGMTVIVFRPGLSPALLA